MKIIDKKTILAALVGGVSALLLTAGGVALAHGGGHGGPHAKSGRWTPERIEAHLAEMSDRLDLSAAQAEQVQTVMQQARAQAEDIREMPRGEEKFLAMKDLHFATEDRIYANLSCEQREELRLLKREHKLERMQERFERHHGSDNP
jgi:Spy/CpxP family protein refolding chaperone